MFIAQMIREGLMRIGQVATAPCCAVERHYPDDSVSAN